jgi:hypothetical protein
VNDTPTTEVLREALEKSDRCLRRLAKAVEDAQNGAGSEEVDLWLARARRRRRANTELLGQGGTKAGRGGRDKAAAASGERSSRRRRQKVGSRRKPAERQAESDAD